MKWEDISSEDTNVIMHLYRGELQRINTWRTRMDRTTNWSIVITVGVLTWALSSPQTPHWAILPGLFLVYALLFVEARRYRYYDMWRGRVRVLEEKFLSKFFNPNIETEKGWEKLLSADLLKPRFKISWQEAVKRRLKRVYLWIITVFAASWIAKIYLHPSPISSLKGFFNRVSGSMDVLPGIIIVGLVLGFIGVSTAYFYTTVPQRKAKGKPKEEEKEKFGTEDYIEEIEEELKDVEEQQS